jgi:hypothetical protein
MPLFNFPMEGDTTIADGSLHPRDSYSDSDSDENEALKRRRQGGVGPSMCQMRSFYLEHSVHKGGTVMRAREAAGRVRLVVNDISVSIETVKNTRVLMVRPGGPCMHVYQSQNSVVVTRACNEPECELTMDSVRLSGFTSALVGVDVVGELAMGDPASVVIKSTNMFAPQCALTARNGAVLEVVAPVVVDALTVTINSPVILHTVAADVCTVTGTDATHFEVRAGHIKTLCCVASLREDAVFRVAAALDAGILRLATPAFPGITTYFPGVSRDRTLVCTEVSADGIRALDRGGYLPLRCDGSDESAELQPVTHLVTIAAPATPRVPSRGV